MGMPVNTTNVVTAFRDSFEAFTPGEKWNVTTAPGDIIQLDGNALAASYFVISKDPWSAGTESILESTIRIKAPLETSVGLHTSQRTLGQELFAELVSDEEPLPVVADVEIVSISQAATTLTIVTATPTGLRPGQRFGVRDTTDSRLAYSALVASAVNGTTVYATSTPAGTITSLTAGPFAGGYVYFRPAMGRARNGASMVLENTSSTNASFYVRADAGDALPSGAMFGNHSVTISSTLSLTPGASSGAYIHQPTTDYRVRLTPDEVFWSDVSVDSPVGLNTRLRRSQVVPSPDVPYKLRFRAVNNKSLSRPVACILSVTKTGTTTATVVCDRPHGLTLTSYISAVGPRDTSSFPTLAVTVPLAIIDGTTFTVAWGAAVTASSYGGTVNLVVGSQQMQGTSVQVVQNAVGAGGVLQLVGNGNWSGAIIGDYVNAAGIVGQSGLLNLDGTYRVKDLNGINLYLEPIGDTPAVADFVTMNAGGAIIKRTDLRLSWVRAFDYDRQRVEFAQRGTTDQQQSLAVIPTGGSLSIVGGTSNIGYSGQYAPALPSSPDVSSAAITSNSTTSAINPGAGLSHAVTIAVTAVTGTNPTMDVNVEVSDDNGTNWYLVYSFPRISATGMYRSPKLPINGTRVRYVQTLGGTSPNFTRQINRAMSHDWAQDLRQLIDRTITMTSLNSVTPSLDVRTCRNVQLQVLTISATSAAVLQLEGSDDNGISWWPIGAALTATANSSSPSVLTVNNVHAGLVRARVSTAGTGVVYSNVLLKGF